MKKIYIWMSFLLIAYLMGSIGLQFFNFDDSMDYGVEEFENKDSDLFDLTGTTMIVSGLLGFGVAVVSLVASGFTIPLDKSVAYGFFTGVFSAIWGLGTGMIDDVTTQANSIFHTELPLALILTIMGIFIWAVGMVGVMGTDIEGY